VTHNGDPVAGVVLVGLGEEDCVGAGEELVGADGAGVELGGAGVELDGVVDGLVGVGEGDGGWWWFGFGERCAAAFADRLAAADAAPAEDAMLSGGVQPAVAAAMAFGLDSMIMNSCLS
jgi:hypothetical protein